MNYVIEFIIPLVYYILTNGLSVLIFKKSFGKTLPMTIMITSFNIFISQILFKTFLIGYIINLILPIIFIILLIKNRKNLEQFKKDFFSNGFYTFIIFYIGIFIFDLNRKFTKWDEYSHWGVMVKEMLRLDKLYSSELSTLMVHKDYPPMISIYELFYTKLTFVFKEETLIKTLHLFNASLIIPFIDNNVCKKNIIKSVTAILSMFLIILLFDQHDIINTIYIDYTVSLLTAYMLSIVFIEENNLTKFNIINLIIGLSFLILSKQIGLPFCLMIIFLFILKTILKTKPNKSMIINILLVTIIPIIFFFGWNKYVSKLDIEKQFVISNVIEKRVEPWQKEALNNYLIAIKNRSLLTSYIKLSYIFLLIIVLLLLYLVCKKIYNKKEIIILGSTYTLGFIGYFLVMLGLYTTSFGPYEGVILASFDRYMPSFVLICISSIYMIYIKNSSLKKTLIILTILLLIQNPIKLKRLIPKVKKTEEHIFQIQADKIKRNTKANTKVFLIAQNTSGEYQFGVKFYLDTQTTNLNSFNLPTSNIDDYEKYYNENIKEYMLEFDYLYLSKLDESFYQKYHFLFNEPIKENNLYKIDNDKLILMEEK